MVVILNFVFLQLFLIVSILYIFCFLLYYQIHTYLLALFYYLEDNLESDDYIEALNTIKKKIDGRETEYYVLKPVYEHGVSTAYVPVENEQLTAKLRPLLSRQEVVELIDSLPHMQTPWIESQDVRREKYREILHKGDRTAMIRAIRALHLHRREPAASAFILWTSISSRRPSVSSTTNLPSLCRWSRSRFCPTSCSICRSAEASGFPARAALLCPLRF